MGMIKLAVTLTIYLVIAEVGADGPGECSGVCVGDLQELEKCTAQNWTVNCDSTSIGTSHCYVAIYRYNTPDETGQIGYVSGCMDCTDKQKACNVLKEVLKAQKQYDFTSCEIECCNTTMCNTNLRPTLPPSSSSRVSISYGSVVLVAAYAARFGV